MTEPRPPAERRLLPVPSGKYPAYVDKYALLVGISAYRNDRLRLKYADRDAQALYDLLQKPSGGGFEPARMRLLLNDEATGPAITRALRSFLKEPKPEDIVFIYFAGHGAPDPNPDYRRIVYLLPYDADPDDISGTALRMSDVDQWIRDYLRAERQVVILDTCHSAAIAGGARAVGGDPEAAKTVQTYMQELSQSRPGVALLTSAAADEAAREDAMWGEGHGVLTHFLLEGMAGKADGYGPDARPDGKVTAGELFDYVCDKVAEATGGRQHPFCGAHYDRNLPMAITGGIEAEDHVRLGQGLSYLGRLTDDAGRFRSASTHFEYAMALSRQAGSLRADAVLGLGQSLLSAGEAQKAADLFERETARGALRDVPEALLDLGVARARLGDRAGAAAALRAFARRAPGHETAAWAAEYAAWLEEIQSGRRLALLIGINRYRSPRFVQLEGCLNDVRLMHDVLTERFGFDEVETLTDADATARGVRDALRRLAGRATARDTVLIHYSGHAVPGDSPEFLVVHDTRPGTATDPEQGVRGGIRADELHDLLKAIPTPHTTLTLDTHPNTVFLALAERDRAYALLIASDNEITGEETVEWQGEPLQVGTFTYALAGQLLALGSGQITYRQLMEPVRDAVQQSRPQQNPRFIGSLERRVFAEADDHLEALELSRRLVFSGLSADDLAGLRTRFRERVQAPFPALHAALGRAWLGAGLYQEAIEALEAARAQRGGADDGLLLPLALAQIGARRYDDALSILRALPSPGGAVQDALAAAEGFAGGGRYALLVGVDEVPAAHIRLRGARNDALAMQRALVERCGFDPTDVVLLLDGDATGAAVLREFEALAARARFAPALFFFAGCGSEGDGGLTLVPADGRQGDVFDIGLDELAVLARDATYLTAVLDAGWSHASSGATGARWLDRDPRPRPKKRDVTLPRREGAWRRGIGRASLYHRSATTLFSAPFLHHERELPNAFGGGARVQGRMTHALVSRLLSADPASLTYRDWVEGTDAILLGEAPDGAVFDAPPGRALLLDLLARAEQEPLRETIELLRQVIERRGGADPQGYLDLGAARAAMRDWERAVECLKNALAQKDDFPEARYHLGRVLVEGGGSAEWAVKELRQAVQGDPADVRARYYLGRALQSFAQQDILAEAERAYRAYLADGAPLGHAAEVEEFLAAREKARAR